MESGHGKSTAGGLRSWMKRPADSAVSHGTECVETFEI